MKLKEKDILAILEGASFLAGGGGGACKDAHILLEAFKEKYPKEPIEIDLISIEEMEDEKKTAGIAVMGAPTGGTNLDITPCIVNAFEKLKSYEKEVTISYTLPLELGGFNTFVPILISLIEKIPMIDADCCGRAVPGLDTTLAYINGCTTGPIVMADTDNDTVILDIQDNHDAEKLEQLALPIVEQFHQNAGIAGWMYTKKDMHGNIPEKTISLCLHIGRIIMEKEEDIFHALQTQIGIKSRCIANKFQIKDFHSEQSGGWDIGTIELSDDKEVYFVAFTNENLALFKSVEGKKQIVATVPDIITLYDTNEHKVLTNEDLMELYHKNTLFAHTVSVGVVRADELWYQKNTDGIWDTYFDLIHYQEGVFTI